MGDKTPAFRLDGPLPKGRAAIEASAGTGKTHTLSTLAARYVAESDVPIANLLIVTFTRAAAAELRDRVRARLVEFADVLSSDSPPEDRLLLKVWQTDRETRLLRVSTAISDFDSATITTIHGFAQQVLGTLGSAVQTDPDAVLIDDSDTLTIQVATDLLVAEAVHEAHPANEIPDLKTLKGSTRLSLDNPDAALVPGNGFQPASVPEPGGVPTDGNDPAIGTDDAKTPDDDVSEDGAIEEQARTDREAVRRLALVRDLVETIGTLRRDAGTISFDDLLARLHDAVTDKDSGRVARRVLQERFQVALIDEFQDTDPVQWKIFDSVFGIRSTEIAGNDIATTLVLVGDPKQAIYAFRGANVHTYLTAVRDDDAHLSGLDRNWRSDPAVLNATGALLSGVTFGATNIEFQPVDVSPDHQDRAFLTADGDPIPALSIRIAAGAGVPRNKSGGFVNAGGGESAIFREMAAHIRYLLESAVIPDEDHDDGRTRRLRPDDVVVLITANRQGPKVRDALLALDIPAVVSRGDNVLESEAAGHWHRLLQALARPADSRRARAATTSWFFGWDANRLAAASEEELNAVQERLHHWGEHLSSAGVAAFVGRVWAETSVAARVLALHDGDRAMTDLDHLAELLSLAGDRNASPTTLLTSFEQLAGGSDDGNPEADLAARRVESESRAVQIMTTFVAKGLEFPVVCCPTLWNPMGATARDNIWWDSEMGKRRIDVASDLEWGSPTMHEDRKSRAASEAVGSNLRVLYVALTRARHHTALWWLPTKNVWSTGLARVLFARHHEQQTAALPTGGNEGVDSTPPTAGNYVKDADTGRIDPEDNDVEDTDSDVGNPDSGDTQLGDIDRELFSSEQLDPIDEEESLRRLAPVIERAGGDLEVVIVGDGDRRVWTGGESPADAELRVATLDHDLDRDRTRWSFTAITSRAKGADTDGFDPADESLGDSGDADEGHPTTDEAAIAPNEAVPGEADVVAGEEAMARDAAFIVGGEDAFATGKAGITQLPLGEIAGGAGFGTLVHEVLERIDFEAADLESELVDLIDQRLAWSPWPVDRQRLAEGLAAVIRTPLGPLFAGQPLNDLASADRLDELTFDLTLGEAGAPTTDADVGNLLVDHMDNDDPLRGWAQALATGSFSATLAGHLTGSIDLVARVRHHDGPDRFVVCDYKTNRLARWGVVSTPDLFRPDQLPTAMTEHHYPLQALLYSVALHRYLRWRLNDYDPSVHLGGIGYMFVRGMVGPDTPTTEGVPNGLFDWRPPANMITDLSNLLDGSTASSLNGSTASSLDGSTPNESAHR